MTATATLNLGDPQHPHLDCEHAHWAAQAGARSRDPAHWAGLEDGERDLLYFVLGSHIVVEEHEGALAEFGLGALTRRLAMIGVSLDGSMRMS